MSTGRLRNQPQGVLWLGIVAIMFASGSRQIAHSWMEPHHCTCRKLDHQKQKTREHFDPTHPLHSQREAAADPCEGVVPSPLEPTS